MAINIENAVKGQRNAMNALYEANKQKVYFIARCLLTDEAQAQNATVTMFRWLPADEYVSTVRK